MPNPPNPLTAADLLAAGLGLSELAAPPEPVAPGTTCALTGAPIYRQSFKGKARLYAIPLGEEQAVLLAEE